MTTNLIKNQCCICHNKVPQRLFRNVGQHSLLICSHCKLVYLERYPSHLDQFLKDISNAHQDPEEQGELEFWSVPNFYEKYKEIFQHFFYERYTAIKKHHHSFDKALDVGCGYGFWPAFLQQKGVDVSAVEVDEQSVKYCQNQWGFPIYEDYFENFQPQKRFHLISFVDVLEHFPRPDKALLKARECLSPEGFIFVQVPNVLGLKIPYGHNLGLPYHLWQFTPSTLKKLFKKSGFQVVSSWTGVQGVIGAYERGEVGMARKLMWRFAKITGRGNRLHVIAKPS